MYRGDEAVLRIKPPTIVPERLNNKRSFSEIQENHVESGDLPEPYKERRQQSVFSIDFSQSDATMGALNVLATTGAGAAATKGAGAAAIGAAIVLAATTGATAATGTSF
uniref:Uncharacterized protein n=1 Tax=Glossina pallidipes TaxID=7398 RepID=A0A1A9ZKE7_GLOPL